MNVQHAAVLLLVLLTGAVSATPADATWSQPAAQALPPIRVLAAGDSFASGEGLPNIQRGEDRCQRALGLQAEGDEPPSEAWPVLVKESFERRTDGRKWSVDPFWFTACTGNVTHQFARRATQQGAGLSQLGEAQRDAGTSPWGVILLSFGGNDVGFSEIIQDCVGLELTLDDFGDPEVHLPGGRVAALLNGSFAGCSLTEPEMKDRIQNGRPSTFRDDVAPEDDLPLPQALDKLYEEVAANAMPGALIVVTGYPQLFAEPSTWPLKERIINRCNRVSEGDARAIRGATGYLNQTIGAAVERARAAHPGLEWVFVDVNRSFENGDPDDSKALCGPDEWINGFSFGGISDGDFRGFRTLFNRSFHPNQRGHEGYARVVIARIVGSKWTPDALRSGACDPVALAEAYERATGTKPVSVEVRGCTEGWALAMVVHPVTGDTDGINLFRLGTEGPTLVGDVVPTCVEELVRLGVAEEEAGALGLESCGVGSGWPVDDNEGSPAFFALQGATARITDWSSCSDEHCIGGLDDEIGVWSLRPLDYLGAFPATTDDPLQSLLDVGFSDSEARILLTPGPPP